ncbi:hypothetical protein ACS0TY_019262 [Phlomoides rotata]
MEEYAVALSLFDEMRHSSLPVNEFTMNIIINCCCHLNRVDFWFAVLGSFLKQDYEPNVTTFNTLLKGLFLVGNVAKAEALFNKVLTFRLCEPNDVMILTVINGLRPNVQIYTTVIGSLYKEGLDEEAKCLLNEMEKNGCAPDDVTYNFIVYSLLKRNEVYKAIVFLEEMQNRGFKAHSANVSMILDMVVKGIDINLVEVIKKVVPQLKNELSDVF